MSEEALNKFVRNRPRLQPHNQWQAQKCKEMRKKCGTEKAGTKLLPGSHRAANIMMQTSILKLSQIGRWMSENWKVLWKKNKGFLIAYLIKVASVSKQLVCSISC